MRGLLWTLAVLLPACSSGECGEPRPLDLIQSGAYVAEAGEPTDRNCVEGCGVVFPPHDGAESLSLELDLENSVAIVSFVRDGAHVEERWRIVSRRSY